MNQKTDLLDFQGTAAQIEKTSARRFGDSASARPGQLQKAIPRAGAEGREMIGQIWHRLQVVS